MPELALTTVAVTLAAWVVGRATLPLFLGRRALGRGALGPDALGRDAPPLAAPLQLELLLGNALIGIAGLLLAEAGVFSLARLLVGLALVGVTAAATTRLSGWFAAPPAYGRRDAIGITLAVLAWLWAFPPLDTTLFGSDSTVYATAGIHLASHGSLVLHDPTVAMLAPSARAAWFPAYLPDTGRPPFLRVGGGLLLNDRSSATVLPAFQPLLSVWVAIFGTLGGDGALMGPVTYFGALFVWAFASFVEGLADRWTAAAAVVLLTSLVPQYWYSRFLMPEVPSQYFLWAGFATAAAALAAPRTRLGAVAGVALGVAGLMRLDVLIQVWAALALWTAIAPSGATPAGSGFLPGLLVVTAHALGHLVAFPTHYGAEVVPRVLVVLDTVRRFHPASTLTVGVLGAAVLVAAWRLHADRRLLLRGGLRLAAGAAFVAYASAIVATAWPDLATNLAWLRLYVGWPLLATAVAGILVWQRAARSVTASFVLLFALVATGQLFFYPPVSPQPLWAIRRMLRIVIPSVTIAAAVAVTAAARGRWRIPVAIAGVAMLLGFGPRLAFSYRQPAYERTMMHVRTLGALLPPGSVVLGDPAFLAESQLHVALWMTRDTPAYFVSRTNVEKLSELRTAIPDRPMFWIGPGSRGPLTTAAVRVVPVASYAFSVATRRMEPYDDRDDLGLRAMTVSVYRLDAG